jgi:hypothetical protein
MSTFETVRDLAVAFLTGRILTADHVTAGRGKVIDWRDTPSGDELLSGADAFDTAVLFVALVGVGPAGAALAGTSKTPDITRFNGGRRVFKAHGFSVHVEPHEDDEAAAAFTERLAAFAAS